MPAGRWLVFDTNVYVVALREGASGHASELLRRFVPRTYLAPDIVEGWRSHSCGWAAW